MCIVMDEIGGNISHKADDHIGGNTLMCGKGIVPQQKSSNKDKHSNLLGLTNLYGDPMMCVVIFAGKRRNSLYKTRIDVFVEKIGDAAYDDFLIQEKKTLSR